MSTKPNFYKHASDVIRLIPKERVQDILRRRFGFDGKEPETLESIGRDYKITRERVRQIENDGFRVLKELGAINRLSGAVVRINKYLDKHGKAKREDILLHEVSEGDASQSPAVYFILNLASLDNIFKYHKDNNNFYATWSSDPTVIESARDLVEKLVEYFEQEKRVLSKNHVLKEHPKIVGQEINPRALESYIQACKHIEENDFGELGLFHWPEIKPRGVKDKAYIVLKQKGKPLHFTDIAALIGQLNKSWNDAHPQTVHNKLIKDARFVLVGRGIYGLNEWGYVPGTVKDVIAHILSQKGPLNKEDIIKRVLDIRMVKENTILINLQNGKRFARLEDGKYTVLA